MRFAPKVGLFAVVACAALSGCSSKQGALNDQDAALPAPQCAPQLPDACPEPVPGFASDIQPLLESHCASCHGALEGPWPLRTYKDVTDWQSLVRTLLLDCSMPPPDAGSVMTNDERNTVLTWLSCGMPM